jgi:NitT/TauT family transport system substrate-binding protein
MRLRITRLMISSITASIALLVGLPQAAYAQPLEKVRIAVSFAGLWTSSQPIFCRDRGEFKKAGIDLDAISTRGGSENVQAVITGAVDIGYGPGIASVFAAQMQGAPIKIISSNYVGNSDSFFYVRAGSPLNSLADVKPDTTIAYTRPGSVSEAILRDIQNEKGINFKTVSGGSFDAIFTMVMTRQIDVGVATPPSGIAALKKGEIRVLFDGNSDTLQRDVASRVNIANAIFIKNHRATAVSFLHVLHDCVDWMYTNRTEADKMYAALNQIDNDTANRSMAFYSRKDMELTPISGLATSIKQAVTDKFIDKPPTDAQLKNFIDLLYREPPKE